MNDTPRIYKIPFANIYPLYVQKAVKKGRTKAEVDDIIYWMTGHDAKSLEKALIDQVSLEAFYAQAPKMNPIRRLITGEICGVRVEEIKDPVMQEIRYMDKLIDELARGKSMKKILRQEA